MADASGMAPPVISLVIPTYNERENIELAIKHAFEVLREGAQPFEVIVVDDDSPDRTWEAAEVLCDDYPGLRVVHRRNERGLARAVVRGWQEARGEILAVMDGDLQHPSETLGRLVKAVQNDGVDIAVASRHVVGGGVSRWNIIRRAVSWSATLMATWLLPGTIRTIRDPMSGYFALRRSVIEGCRLEPEGYKILLEVLGRGRYRCVEEIPYTFVERKRGGSKLGPRQYGEFIVHLLRLSWRTGELNRFLKFSAVGGSGLFVNMGMLTLLASAGLGYLQSGIFAVETAIVTNFLLNEFWSFSDLSKRRPGVVSRLSRFLTFNLFCVGGAVINLAVLWVLTEVAGIHYLLSNLFGIGAATFWNYGMNANITWESIRAAQKKTHPLD
ncbi:MAG: glycosyltransferase family 2 protein [Nitrospirae bacterium]|nr:glycosyltransferase family 2 protein [Nitrospirota bacterium]